MHHGPYLNELSTYEDARPRALQEGHPPPQVGSSRLLEWRGRCKLILNIGYHGT